MRAREKVVLIVSFGILLGVIGWKLTPEGALASDKDRVKLRVRAPSSVCKDPTLPMLVEIENRSEKTIRNAHFTVEIHERGDSRDFASDRMRDLDWTVITRPGETKQICYEVSLTKPVSEPFTVFRLNDVTFYESNETIPR